MYWLHRVTGYCLAQCAYKELGVAMHTHTACSALHGAVWTPGTNTLQSNCVIFIYYYFYTTQEQCTQHYRISFIEM